MWRQKVGYGGGGGEGWEWARVICLSWPIGLGNGPLGLGNGPYMLGNGLHMFDNGPFVLGNGLHACFQFMNRVILIMGRLGWVICLSWPYWVR